MFDDVFWNVPRNMTWLNFLPAYAANASPEQIGNDSIDVMSKGCFAHFNTVACIRNGVMSMLMLLTGALCVVKVCRLHLSHHPNLHQYTIFYCAMLETILCAIHWLLGLYAQLDFVAQYLKLVQFLVVSHFYWMLATRALRKEVLTQRVLVPLFAMALVYFTIVTIVACLNVKPSWIECYQPYWLALSSAEFALVQLFMLAGVYLTRRLNEISTLDSVRRAQKRDLWSLVIAYELSALVGLIYDISLNAMADEERGCSGVFLHMQEIYSPIFGLFMMIKFMLPLWAMLFVFHPLELSAEHEELHQAVSEEGTYSSVFAPQFNSRHSYKPLFHPPGVAGGMGGSVGGASGVTGGDVTPSDSDITPSPTSTTPIVGPTLRNISSLATISEEVIEPREQESTVVDDSDRRPILS